MKNTQANQRYSQKGAAINLLLDAFSNIPASNKGARLILRHAMIHLAYPAWERVNSTGEPSAVAPAGGLKGTSLESIIERHYGALDRWSVEPDGHNPTRAQVIAVCERIQLTGECLWHAQSIVMNWPVCHCFPCSQKGGATQGLAEARARGLDVERRAMAEATDAVNQAWAGIELTPADKAAEIQRAYEYRLAKLRGVAK